jgi:hypothetical protein
MGHWEWLICDVLDDEKGKDCFFGRVGGVFLASDQEKPGKYCVSLVSVSDFEVEAD